MAEITIRRTGEFLRKAFEFLFDKSDGAQAKEVLEHIAETTELTEYEKGYYESSPTNPRFHKIIRFATIGCVKAGWLVKEKGIWYLTDDGKKAYRQYTDPEKFYREAVRLYREWKKSLPEEDSETDSVEEEAESVTFTFEEAEEMSWEQIQQFIQGMNPYEFQDLVAELLKAIGYHISWIAPPGMDQGIDIIAYSDPLGTKAPRIKVQVKRVLNPISVEGLRAFMSVLGNDDVGIYVSSGGFTKNAKDEARNQESRKITLIDLQRFFDLWVESYNNLSQDARQKFPLKPIYFLAPDE